MPTAEHLTARCWSRNDLYTLFACITAKADLPQEFSNTEGFLAYLGEVGWVSTVALDRLTKAGPPGGFYLLDPSAVATRTAPDPLELLQAYQSAGVICYFSALAYHSLTTQVASHHHIANPRLPVPSQDDESRQTDRLHAEGPQRGNATVEPVENGSTSTRRKRNPLGTEVFVYQGVPCYLHHRQFILLQGAQVRDVDARTRLRITSREQTLLDALQKPAACGGAAVVFEAWENGVLDLDEERLAKRLRGLNHALIFRRVGAMLERLGYQAGSELQSLLQEHQFPNEESRFLFTPPASESTESASVAAVSPAAPQAVALLPGYPFATLLPRWGVLVP